MTKRLRRPKIVDGELQVYWGRENPKDCPEVVFAWQGDSSMRRDARFLYYHMGSERPYPSAKPPFSKMLPSLLEQLEARGYDMTTLWFSIKKKVSET